MSLAYIGIGSNLANREQNCEKAIQLISEKGLTVLKRSPMIETEPWGVSDQPSFINMAVQVETMLSPEKLLTLLKDTERETGRLPGVRWGPRVIDLDILFYDDLVMKTADLEIPHRQIEKRGFVLKPLLEIAPELIHPVSRKKISRLLKELSGQ